MADKRPVVLDTATGQIKELAPPDKIDPVVLPEGAGEDFAFFIS